MKKKPTFRKIVVLTPADVEAEKAAAAKAHAEHVKRMQRENDGPYGRAINKQMDKTGRERGVKLPDSTKSIAPVDSVTLYNDSQFAGQFKQWSIWTEGRNVITEWGRTGSTLITKAKQYASPSAAEKAMQKTINTKRFEGYRNNP